MSVNLRGHFKIFCIHGNLEIGLAIKIKRVVTFCLKVKWNIIVKILPSVLEQILYIHLLCYYVYICAFKNDDFYHLTNELQYSNQNFDVFSDILDIFFDILNILNTKRIS